MARPKYRHGVSTPDWLFEAQRVIPATDLVGGRFVLAMVEDKRLEKKRVVDSVVVLTQFMQPEHANNLGNVHGGWVMKLIDEAGGLCAMRHARRPAVTVAVDSLRFLSPVHVGDLVTFTARLTYVGRTSMEIEVHVEAEDILTGNKTHTNDSFLVFVALDEAGRPIEVPSLLLETDDDRRRWEQGKQRQADRLVRARRQDLDQESRP